MVIDHCTSKATWKQVGSKRVCLGCNDAPQPSRDGQQSQGQGWLVDFSSSPHKHLDLTSTFLIREIVTLKMNEIPSSGFCLAMVVDQRVAGPADEGTSYNGIRMDLWLGGL